jgi:uncharacterized RDD family membrane protein YckC
MGRLHRSSDGPVPYGPSGSSPAPAGSPETGNDDATAVAKPGDAPAAPGDASPTSETQPWGTDSAPTPPGPPRFVSGPAQPPAPPSAVPPPIAPWAPPPGAYSTSVEGAHGLVYGRTLDRVMAWWLDSIIVAVPALILAVLLGGGAASAGLRLGGASLVASIIAVGIHLLYFVAFWTGSSRATPAMRLFKLQIGDAKTGAVLTVQQGMVRWLAIGGVFQVVEIIPALAVLGAFLAFVWVLLLLATTATSPTKQGLHDRMADTALVQPAGAQTPAMACLLLLIGLFVVWVLAVVALIFLGGQISQILSNAGASI